MLTDRYLDGIPADSRIRTDGRFLKEDVVNSRIAQVRKLNALALQRGQTLGGDGAGMAAAAGGSDQCAHRRIQTTADFG